MVSDLFDDPKTTFGLDIGYDSLKIIQIKKTRKGFTLKSINSVPIPNGSSQKDHFDNPDIISEALGRAIRDAKPEKVSGHFVISSLPESQVFTKIITLPKLKPADLERSIHFEAGELFPLPPEELYLDWQILYEKKADTNDTPAENTPKTDKESNPKEASTQISSTTMLEILVVAAAKKVVEAYQGIIKKAGLELAILETKPISSARAIMAKDEQKCVLLVDIGAEATGLSIIDEGILRFTGTVTCGGNAVTRALAEKDTLPDNETEKRKILHEIDSNLHTDTEKKKEIVTRSLMPIIEEINQAIRFYQNRIKSDDKLYGILLTGGGSNLPFITEILEAHTGYHTGIANPFTNVIQPKDQSYSSFCAYTASLGCALRPYMEQ